MCTLRLFRLLLLTHTHVCVTSCVPATLFVKLVSIKLNIVLGYVCFRLKYWLIFPLTLTIFAPYVRPIKMLYGWRN